MHICLARPGLFAVRGPAHGRPRRVNCSPDSDVLTTQTMWGAEDHEDDVMDINRDVHTWLEESEHSAESMQGARRLP